MELKDLMELKALGGGSLSTYEQYKVGDMQRRNHTSGIGVAGLVTGISGIIVGAAAWLGSSMYGNAKSKEAKESAQSAKELAASQYAATLQLMTAKDTATQRQFDQLTNLFAAERQERINGDITLNATINDTVSGQQSGQLTASQIAQQEAAQSVMTGLMTGRYSENPQRVALYRDATPCPCPAGGCGCNG